MHTSTVDVALPAFAVERRPAAPLLLCAGQQSIDILPAGRSAENPQQRRAAGELWDRQTDRQTERRTPDRYIL